MSDTVSAHTERKREQRRRWRRANPEKHAKQQREWRANNREAARAISQRASRKRTPEQKAAHAEQWMAIHAKRNEGWSQVPRRQARWQEWEITAIFDSSKSTAEIAKNLGRSYRAVELARARYIEYQPVGWNDKSGRRPRRAKSGCYRQ